MSMKYVRDYYGVPAKRGGRIRYTGEISGEILEGSITSANGASLMVKFDDSTRYGNRSVKLHPTYEIEYLNAA